MRRDTSCCNAVLHCSEWNSAHMRTLRGCLRCFENSHALCCRCRTSRLRNIIEVDRRRIVSTDRTSERDLRSWAHPHSTWFFGTFARLGKNGLAKNHAPLLHQGGQIAGPGDREADPAQVGFVIAKHREARPFIGREWSHEIGHAALRCIAQASD